MDEKILIEKTKMRMEKDREQISKVEISENNWIFKQKDTHTHSYTPYRVTPQTDPLLPTHN